jgi:hypothetical protein
MSADHYNMKHVVELLSRMGYKDLAEEAPKVLPDPVEVNQLSNWLFEHGLSYDDLISQMGGSP